MNFAMMSFKSNCYAGQDEEKKVTVGLRREPGEGRETVLQVGDHQGSHCFKRSSTGGQNMKSMHYNTMMIAPENSIQQKTEMYLHSSHRSPGLRKLSKHQFSSLISCSPPSNETGQQTPPCMRWAQNLHILLDDNEGVELFEKFLIHEGCELHDLKFWFACKGLKKYPLGSKLDQTIKIIFKKYLKSSLVRVKTTTKQEISEKINSRHDQVNGRGLDQNVFDRAQRELEETFLQNSYLNFLKSETYLQHIQKSQQEEIVSESYEEEQQDDEELTGGNTSTNSREGLNFLPTLHEDKEIGFEPNLSKIPFVPFAQRESRRRSSSTRYVDSLRSKPDPRLAFQGPSHHLRYSGYLPTSVQDSELQSLSSDAQTDDSISVTTEGSGQSCRSFCKHQQRAMKKNANMNKDPNIHQNFIPRTQRVPLERLVEKDPVQFAAVLIEKLIKVKKDIDGYAQLDYSLKQIEKEDNPKHYPSLPTNLEHFTQLPPQLLLSSNPPTTDLIEENDQSILDQHVSRIWNDSNCQSPLSRTPGGQISPPSLPLDRRRFVPMPSWNPAPVAFRPYRSRERDICSTDSGNVNDYIPNETPQLTKVNQGDLVNAESNRRYKEQTTRRVKKALTDSGSSCVDSGVSVCDQLPFSERVYSWVLDNEKNSYNKGGTDSEKDSKHKKSSSISTNSSLKQSTSRKACSYPSSRPGSLEPPTYWSRTPGPMEPTPSQPSQPVAQDLSMPILPPPDTTTQLVEAKRRLEDEAAKAKNTKTKKSTRRLPSNANMTNLGATSSTNVSLNNTMQDMTVIGYCFSGESVPYRTKLAGRNITLKQFKALVSKKGNFRYFFKRSNNEFGTGVVNEEVSDENELLPLWEGKIFCTLEPCQE